MSVALALQLQQQQTQDCTTAMHSISACGDLIGAWSNLIRTVAMHTAGLPVVSSSSNGCRPPPCISMCWTAID